MDPPTWQDNFSLQICWFCSSCRAAALQGLDAEGIALYLQQLPQAFLQCEPQVAPPQAAPGDTEDELQADAAALVSAVNARRAWIIEQMTAAARLPNSAEESVVEAAKFLSLHAFCTVPSAGKVRVLRR